MWQLTPAAIAQAKEEVGRRHAETLTRHAQEIAEWEAAQAEVAALDKLLGAFAARFATPPPPPAVAADLAAELVVEAAAAGEAAATPGAEPSPAETSNTPAAPPADDRGREKPAARGRNAQQRNNPATNFDTFSRALSRSI